MQRGFSGGIMTKTILVAYSFGKNAKFGYSGIDRYSQELDEGLTSIGYEHDRYAYEINNPFKRLFSSPKAVKGYDVIHLTQPHGYEAFTGSKAKKILTWHDNMIFTRKSKVHFYNIYRGLMAYNLADIITFNSKQSYTELQDYLLKHNSMYNTFCDITPLPLEDIWIKEKINKKQKRKHFIYIGAINYPHKNFGGLINTYYKMFENIEDVQKPPLHIFTSSPNADEMEDIYSVYPYPIFFHSRASDEEIKDYLKEAIALLHLSQYEGYGLPLLESIAVGTPVITLKEAKIPEETAKWTIRTDNPVEEALKLYNKPRSASQEAISYAKSLTKENYAKKMVKLYD